MEIAAVVLLGFFALGYFALAGADIGVGMTLPFVGRDPAQRRVVIAAIAPFFLGNEVWLVGTAGLLAGAFPVLEGDLLTGLFPAFVALLLGWIVRDMGLWLRGRAGARVWWALCDTAIVTGSWTVALSWGWVLASVLAGSPDELLTGPGAIAAAAAIAALFAAHGLAFGALRLTGTLRDRARALSAPTGERRTFALTGAAMLLLPLVAGLRLDPAGHTADPATLSVLIPVLLVITPLLVAAQAWVWRIFRHRVTGPSYL
jgi:cytochrome d ubiquinol oxidase subunit II